MTLLYKLSQRDIIKRKIIVVFYAFVTILHSVAGDILASLIFHIYLDSSVLYLCLRCLRSRVWLLKRSLKAFSITSR